MIATLFGVFIFFFVIGAILLIGWLTVVIHYRTVNPPVTLPQMFGAGVWIIGFFILMIAGIYCLEWLFHMLGTIVLKQLGMSN